MNPLLSDAELPEFAAIRPEHITPALDVLLPAAEAALERAVSDAVPAEFEALSAALDVPLERLSRAWSAVGHLNAVANTPELREAYNANLGRVTEFHTRLGSDERLYAKYKALAAHPDAATLTPARARRWPMRCATSCCPAPNCRARPRPASRRSRNAAPSWARQFSEHVLDATDGFALYASAEQMAGVPDDVCQRTREAAAAEGKDGHKLTLHFPVYLPVMQYARDRALREQLYRAYVTRASEFGPAELRQQRADDRAAAAARRGGRAARPADLRPPVAGAEDGRIARSR